MLGPWGKPFVTLENPWRPRCFEILKKWMPLFPKVKYKTFRILGGSYFTCCPYARVKSLSMNGKSENSTFKENLFFQPLRGENKPLQLGWASHPLPWGNNGQFRHWHSGAMWCKGCEFTPIFLQLPIIKVKNGGIGDRSGADETKKPTQGWRRKKIQQWKFIETYGNPNKSRNSRPQFCFWLITKMSSLQPTNTSMNCSELHHPLGWPIASWWLNQPIWKYQSR